MHFTNLRKVGGSVMLTVPPAFLDLLDLKAGEAVGVTIDGERLVVRAAQRPRVTIEALLAASDYDSPPTPEEREWLDAPRTGAELL